MLEVRNSKANFEARISVTLIAKLFVKYHENYDVYALKNGVCFYPCVRSKCRIARKPIIVSPLCATCLLEKRLNERKEEEPILKHHSLNPLSQHLFQN